MASRDEFDTAGDYVKVSDLIGELVLFTPIEHLEEVTTDFGTKDAIITDLVVLTAEGGPAEYTDVLIFQGSLIGALKRKIVTREITTTSPDGTRSKQTVTESRKMLGVIGKGEAKKGQNAPYILLAANDAQKQMARDYLAGRTIEAATATDESDDPFAVKL